MAELIAPKPPLPGWRIVGEFVAITIRHFPGDTSAREAARQLGLTWSDQPGKLTGTDPWLAWRSPQETIAFGLRRELVQRLLELLAPGRSESAVAVDLSEALGVIELNGPRLDEWLARLVDAMSIPRAAGHCTRARMAEAAVLLLRLADDRVWLVLERPIRAYAENWLAYAHEGAFGADSGNRSQGGPGEHSVWRNEHAEQ